MNRQADRQMYTQIFFLKEDITVEKAQENSPARLERTLRTTECNHFVLQRKKGSTFQSASELVGEGTAVHVCVLSTGGK